MHNHEAIPNVQALDFAYGNRHNLIFKPLRKEKSLAELAVVTTLSSENINFCQVPASDGREVSTPFIVPNLC